MVFFDRLRKTETKKETQPIKAKKTILVAHHTITTTQIISGFLDRAGYNIIGSTHNGGEAVKLFAAEPPDLVVLGIELDEIDGIEVCKTMKTIDPDVPIIMCTVPRETSVIEALKAGASDFVWFPANPDKLNRLIDSVKKHIG